MRIIMQQLKKFTFYSQHGLIKGPVGHLEVAVTVPRDLKQQDKVFVMFHPLPIEGGTMHNKVVTTACRAMEQLGLATVRFNFRGVGESEGAFDHGVGEREDAKAVLNWIRQSYPDIQIWLGGFSFGGAIAYQICHEPNVMQLLTIAPGITRFVMNDFAEPSISIPWLVIQGDADEIIPPQAVYDWLAALKSQHQLIKFEGVGHFFHGQLVPLREAIKQHYQAIL